jgi:hypothetical protein
MFVRNMQSTGSQSVRSWKGDERPSALAWRYSCIGRSWELVLVERSTFEHIADAKVENDELGTGYGLIGDAEPSQ